MLPLLQKTSAIPSVQTTKCGLRSIKFHHFINNSYQKQITFFKGRQSPKFALFFNLRNKISFKNLNEQKKLHQKVLSFDEVMACQSSPFFGPLKNELKCSRGI